MNLVGLDACEMCVVKCNLIMECFHERVGTRFLFVLGGGEFSDDYRILFRKCLPFVSASAMGIK